MWVDAMISIRGSKMGLCRRSWMQSTLIMTFNCFFYNYFNHGPSIHSHDCGGKERVRSLNWYASLFLGLVPWKPYATHAICDPDKLSYRITSVGIFGLCLYLRHYSVGVNFPRALFTFNAFLVPFFWLAAIHQKEK